ncbi:MAG: PLDc N-terminal domain-containing protein, partial [Bacilli bacterium]
MKNIIKILIGAIIQILLFLYLFTSPIYSPIIITMLAFVSIFLAFSILADDNKMSTSKLSWITIILAIPVFGVIFYLIFGVGHMSNYHKKILEDSRL